MRYALSLLAALWCGSALAQSPPNPLYQFGVVRTTGQVNNDFSKKTDWPPSYPLAVQGGTSGGVPCFTSISQLSSSLTLQLNNFVVGGGAGACPTTVAPGLNVLLAFETQANIAGGILVPPSALTANAIVVGGGSGVGPSTVATNAASLTAMGVAPNVAGGDLIAPAALTANALVVGGGSGTGPSTVTTNATTLAALGNPPNAAGGVILFPPLPPYAGSQVSTTNIAATTTPTTCGTTLTAQTLASGSVWRIRAFGNVVAPSSATARTFSIQANWGGTNLTAATTANVLASTAQTTNWEAEVYISGSSTTAAWVTGHIYDSVATLLASGIPTMTQVTPTSDTGLPSGSQTIDFRVNNGTAAVDAYNCSFVTIERMK